MLIEHRNTIEAGKLEIGDVFRLIGGSLIYMRVGRYSPNAPQTGSINAASLSDGSVWTFYDDEDVVRVQAKVTVEG